MRSVAVNEEVKTGVEPGAFPFPIADGPHESRYLTWIRNHSNYMAVRGLLDYVRAVGVLVRGALVNFLIGVPYLLLIAIAVAAFNLVPETPGFHLTPWVLLVGAAWILLFPLATPFFRIARHRRSLQTGTDSSVKQRDRYERSFGAVLLAVLAVAAFEFLPYVLDRFHFWVYEENLGWPALASSVALALAVFSVSDMVLSALGGMLKRVALVAVGAVGLVVPLLVILFVADFLVFADPVLEDLSVVPLLVTAVFPVGILLGLGLGIATRAFSLGDVGRLSLLLVASVFVLLPLFLVGNIIVGAEGEQFEAKLATAVDKLWTAKDLTPRLDRLMRNVAEEPGPALERLVQAIARTRELTGGQGTPGAVGPEVGPAEDLEAQLAGLARLADSLDMTPVADLVEEIENHAPTLSPEDRAGLTGEVHDLLRRGAGLPGLLTPRTTEELLTHVMAIPHEDIQALVGRAEPRYLQVGPYRNPDYPVLSKMGLPMFRQAEEDLSAPGILLRDVRREVTSTAVYSPTRYPEIYRTEAARDVRMAGFWSKLVFVLMLALLVWLFCRLAVDINLTSIHGLYRDRLASAFLIGLDTRGDVDIEEDLDLAELCRHETGSTAPYHLINVALNLQGSRDISIRDRMSDFFIFSKRFIGGGRTGYCRAETMERVFPQTSLSTAMAISAAAASPNMGRATSPGLVAVMTLLNVRLGFWVPNPGVLEETVGKPRPDGGRPPRLTFDEVFQEELVEIERRWEQCPGGAGRRLAPADEGGSRGPTVAHGLAGIGFSGGGIRSATVNLGIAQALDRRGVFGHMDYMSTVSGGGYLGSSLSSLMRRRTRTVSEISGRVSLATNEAGQKVVTVAPDPPRRSRFFDRGSAAPPTGPREYAYAGYARLAVEDGERVRAGQRLIRMASSPEASRSSFGEQFRWRVRPGALLQEMLGRLDETHRWVNVSDGGHIENLAGIELLRRRCRYILLGDGEADPEHRFNGLATLIRFARIDLGIHIEIDVDALRLDASTLSRRHWAAGRVHYPGESEPGYLLYLKSSVTGDEDEVIREYRHGHPAFPHESTADQFFDEGQFEAYRSLGQHIGEQVLRHLPGTGEPGGEPGASYSDLDQWFETLHAVGAQETDQARAARATVMRR